MRRDDREITRPSHAYDGLYSSARVADREICHHALDFDCDILRNWLIRGQFQWTMIGFVIVKQKKLLALLLKLYDTPDLNTLLDHPRVVTLVGPILLVQLQLFCSAVGLYSLPSGCIKEEDTLRL